ncbi:creatininase family protein [Horticoccus sp. 23ND18S-11]|uniref:creatininase family protein n=1 Tax=Horticoccus sp. 23ND18S-11 TaxID=3391832 RepID=UPI0039C98F07
MFSSRLTPFLPTQINTGPWAAGYSLEALKLRVRTDRIVLPICSLGTAPERLAALAPLVLPPLYHEGLDADPGLKAAIVDRIRACFPFFTGTRDRAEFQGSFDVVELPRQTPARPTQPPRVLAFSIDTAIEQHGPHLPLATDTMQSYAVLHWLAAAHPGIAIGPPIDYGHLTWGLPFGLSIDLTPPLVTRYVRGCVDALLAWQNPGALYVVDVHGSLVHRQAIQQALRESRCSRWAFRWLYDPLVPFSLERGDPHAGGVETALIAHVNRDLVDAQWWPQRVDELAARQMTMAEAVALSSDLTQFIAQVETHGWNGIVGEVRDASTLDAADLMQRMVNVAQADVATLLSP